MSRRAKQGVRDTHPGSRAHGLQDLLWIPKPADGRGQVLQSAVLALLLLQQIQPTRGSGLFFFSPN